MKRLVLALLLTIVVVSLAASEGVQARDEERVVVIPMAYVEDYFVDGQRIAILLDHNFDLDRLERRSLFAPDVLIDPATGYRYLERPSHVVSQPRIVYRTRAVAYPYHTLSYYPYRVVYAEYPDAPGWYLDSLARGRVYYYY